MEKSSLDEMHELTPLHVALWNGNLQQVEECLQSDGQRALETRDARGNRALHLALKFAHRNSTAIVKSLMDAGVRVRSRDTGGWKAIHHAVVTENEEILRLLICREKEQAPAQLQKKIDDVCPRLANVPNFYCEMHVDVSTWVPGISRWLPSDTIKIWKAAQNLRFDITLVGFDSDNTAKTCTDLQKGDTKITESDLDHIVHFLMTTSIVTTDFNASKVTFKRKCAWYSSAPMLQDIGCWKDTRVANMNGVEASLRYRKPQNSKHSPPKSADEHPTARDVVSLLTEVTAVADHNTEVVIHPKSNHIVSVELTKSGELGWKFSTKKHDISFGARFYEKNSREGWNQIVPLHRTQAHVKEQSGSFKATSTGTLELTWDNSYSKILPERLKIALSSVGERVRVATGIDDGDIQTSVKKEEMTFQDWFGISIESLPESLRDLRPRPRILVYTQPSCRTITKSFPATIYMSKQSPLSVSEFLPVIEVLSKTTSAFESVRKFFSATIMDGFPVQFCFPLVPSVSATFRFDRMELQTPGCSVFAVPENYTMLVEDMLSPRTHQAMLQRVTAT